MGLCKNGSGVKTRGERENVLWCLHEGLEKIRRKSVKENADLGQNEDDHHPWCHEHFGRLDSASELGLRYTVQNQQNLPPKIWTSPSPSATTSSQQFILIKPIFFGQNQAILRTLHQLNAGSVSERRKLQKDHHIPAGTDQIVLWSQKYESLGVRKTTGKKEKTLHSKGNRNDCWGR